MSSRGGASAGQADPDGLANGPGTASVGTEVPPAVPRSKLLSPGYATLAMGIGHGVWGLLAYRTGMKQIARAGYLDSVGDGLFRKEHSQDQRAAAFWFMFAAPITALLGYLAEARFNPAIVAR